MMKPAIELQEKGEAFYFIAELSFDDLALRPRRTAQEHPGRGAGFPGLRTRPEGTVFFRQSDVPEVTELTWMLSTVTPMGLLERCTSYKDKVAKGISSNHGLFAYPVLMAADILIYDSNIVPVGRDQKQHVEVTRDIAIKFNEQYGQTFVVPEPQIRDEVAVVPGTDGQKMSKSYGNTVDIFGDEKGDSQKGYGIVMDSRTPQEPKARRREESRHPIAETRRPPTAAKTSGTSARRRPGLWRSEEGPVRALLDLFRHRARKTRGVGGLTWIMSTRFWPTAPPRRGPRRAKF